MYHMAVHSRAKVLFTGTLTRAFWDILSSFPKENLSHPVNKQKHLKFIIDITNPHPF